MSAVPWTELWLRVGEHVLLTGLSTFLAIMMGVPIGIWAAGRARVQRPLLAGIGVLQTIPSLAMLALLLALLGRIGAVPAIIALTLYALLPIVRNTVAGLEGLPPAVLEAARGVGMTRAQRLRLVELPLAAPVLVAGIRTAAVVGVGIATLAAFIGAGGLGQFINRGLALSNTELVLLGAIPAALLALLVDASIEAAEWGVAKRQPADGPGAGRRWRQAAMAAPLGIVALGILGFGLGGAFSAPEVSAGTIRIGSKNFTEQHIIGEIMAELIEARTGLKAERRLGLGGTIVAHNALVAGEIDLYAEYSGTAMTAILDLPGEGAPAERFARVQTIYREKFGLDWLGPFGFNNTYALAVRTEEAGEKGWVRISDIVAAGPGMRAGFDLEFADRADGYPGLQARYGLRFGEVRDLDPSLMYRALALGEVDVIPAFATDGRIEAFGLTLLEDDRGFFPPYHAAPVVRATSLARFPGLGETLGLLAGRIDDATMRALNAQVDEAGRAPWEVARAFLLEEGLIPGD